MKKFIKRLFGIALGIILCCNNLCYADVIDPINPFERFAFAGVLLFPIGILVFVATIISYFVLKIVARKERSLRQINEETQKVIEKNKKILFICIAFLTSWISIGFYIINREYFTEIWIIPVIIILITAIILRVKANKKMAYIFYAIAVVIFGVMCIYGNSVKKEEQRRLESVGRYSVKEIETFNSRIIPYIGENISGSQVNNLIQLANATNLKALRNYESIRRITIIR